MTRAWECSLTSVPIDRYDETFYSTGMKPKKQERSPVQLDQFATMVNVDFTLPQLVCLRCGHRWVPRRQEKPRRCPNPHCHSVCWDEPL
jgi:hypothetical protein